MVAFDELARQISFYTSGDSANYDVVILTFSLLVNLYLCSNLAMPHDILIPLQAYWDTSHSLFLGSFARGVAASANMKLVKRALEIIFESQASDGTWRKGEPIFSQGGDNNGKRDIGNSYVFFFDLVGSIVMSISPTNPELLAPYLPELERCVSWAEANVISEMMADECDPVTNRCRGGTIKGWRSNHIQQGGATAWCTAQVYQ